MILTGNAAIIASMKAACFCLLLFALVSCSSPRIQPERTLSSAPTGNDLWEAYTRTPNSHPNLPNCSFAGYRYSEVPLPSATPTVNVRDWAQGDGIADDTKAFARAIDAASKLGGGAVWIPAGRYRITGMIHLDRPNLVLRGEGPGKTILYFENSLTSVLGPRRANGGPASEYSWIGGLIHVGVKGDLGPTGKLGPEGAFPQSWSFGDPICKVTVPAKRGDTRVSCDPAGAKKIKPGQLIAIRWKNIPDHSLLDEIAGFKGFPWDPSPGSQLSGAMLVRRKHIDWPVEVTRVQGAELTLKQPLRLDLQSRWEPVVVESGPTTSEVGIEEMTLEMKDHLFDPHNQEKGYSGIYFNRVVNGWVRNVRMENVDNGFIGSAIKNVTVSGLELAYTGALEGQKNHTHHGTVLRGGSHDNLITDFRILTPLRHGIETEGLSSGNVWRRGIMKHGTFDSHRLLPHELIRTAIDIHNDGRPGGASGAGPANGARVAHWNLVVGHSGRWIYQPDHFSRGALVGIRGVPIDESLSESMVNGDKGTIVADDGIASTPSDLFQAQLEFRLGWNPCGKTIRCGDSRSP